jgi:Concanavalin A-like lectin/glucanases superfamily
VYRKIAAFILPLAVHCFDPRTGALPELSLAGIGLQSTVSGCALAYQTAVSQSPGVVGYWSFEESSGSIGADSIGGLALNYVSGATPGVPGFASDGTSRALEVSPITNDISAASAATTQTTNISLEVWIYWDGDTTQDHTVFYNGDTSLDGFGLFMTNTGQLAILTGQVAVALVDFTLTPATWTHIVMVRDAVFWNFYVNGSARTILGSLEALPNPAGGVLQLGANRPAFTQLFGGRIDEAAIYNSALSAAQVQSHYAAGCP